MKYFFSLCSFIILFIVGPESYCQPRAKNIIIITTDGLRWQELFGGMDSAIANNKTFNEGDSGYIFGKYWDESALERRKKLMPFFWNIIATQGNIFGNRKEGSKVDVANPHWFSYPGYSELFTGLADPAINSNNFPPNPHRTFLEYLNEQNAYKNRIAAFGAWEAFDRILNEQRSGIPVYNAFDTVKGKITNEQHLINQMLINSYKPWKTGECLDVFTHYAAFEYLKVNQPKVLFIGYGETDEWAHAGKYRSYLDAANQFDKWVEEIWNYLQRNPFYKNNIYLFITTDHGRGDKIKSQWTDHGKDVEGASEIWFAEIGLTEKSLGEVKNAKQWFAKEFANYISKKAGLNFNN